MTQGAYIEAHHATMSYDRTKVSNNSQNQR